MSERYTLYHGDCLEILPTLEAGSVDAVITDPPYGVMLGEVSNGQARERGQDKYQGFSDTPEYVERVAVVAIKMCIQKFPRVIVTPGNRNMFKYPPPDDVGGWILPAATSITRWGFASMNPILYYGKDPRAGRGVWPTSVVMQATRDSDNPHPCPKPLKFMEWLINKASLPNDIILDPFMGSGTTGVAAMRTGRRFIGIELDAEYFRIAEQRIKNAAGEFVRTDKEKRVGQLSLLERGR